MESVRVLGGLVGLLVVVSGCVGSTAGVESASPQPENTIAPPPEFNDETGAITGTVIDDEQIPLADAMIGIPALNLVSETDSSGRFTLSKVPPGRHELVAQKLGHQSAGRLVEVIAGQAVDAMFVLPPLPVEVPHPVTKIQQGNVQCSVRFYPGVPTGGVASGIPRWITGVAVCGAASIPTLPPDKFLLNWEAPDNANEILLEMRWTSTQALGKSLGTPLEVQGRSNIPASTYGTDSGPSPLEIYVNETKMTKVAETSGISCIEAKCKFQTRAFAEANTTELYLPGQPPDIPVLGPPPWKVDAGFTFDQKFTCYLTSFHFSTRPSGFTAIGDA